MSLYPTKTRLALLCAVDANEVRLCPNRSCYHLMHGTGRKVDAAILEMKRHEWLSTFGGIPELTNAGRAVLAQVDGAP